MPQSKSSKRWLKEHFQDPYVKLAQKSGYRSRAAFKLFELNERDKLIHPGQIIVDLGAAPGGWSQAAIELMQGQGLVFALDILEMQPIAGVEFIQGDFCDENVLHELLERIRAYEQQKGGKILADVVLSDMAPNMSGEKSVDQPKAMALAELAWDLASQILKLHGHLVIKAFQGQGFEILLKTLKANFASVAIRKPKASRDRSPEVYLVCKNKL